MFDTIFLDRDGTINGDPLGYINSLSDYHFYDYTIEKIYFAAISIFSNLSCGYFQ